MLAAKKGYLECVKILAPLEKGLTDSVRKTALQHTMKNPSSKKCAQFLW